MTTTKVPGPLSGAGVPSEAFKAHARMKKALKLTGQLIQHDIPLVEALTMGPRLRRMFEHFAEVHDSSDVTWGMVMILMAEREETQKAQDVAEIMELLEPVNG